MNIEQLWLVVAIGAPWAIVLIAAILRGYSIKLWRRNGNSKGGDEHGRG